MERLLALLLMVIGAGCASADKSFPAKKRSAHSWLVVSNDRSIEITTAQGHLVRSVPIAETTRAIGTQAGQIFIEIAADGSQSRNTTELATLNLRGKVTKLASRPEMGRFKSLGDRRFAFVPLTQGDLLIYNSAGNQIARLISARPRDVTKENGYYVVVGGNQIRKFDSSGRAIKTQPIKNANLIASLGDQLFVSDLPSLGREEGSSKLYRISPETLRPTKEMELPVGLDVLVMDTKNGVLNVLAVGDCTRTNGIVRQYDRQGNLLHETQSGLDSPGALASDAPGNVFVTNTMCMHGSGSVVVFGPHLDNVAAWSKGISHPRALVTLTDPSADRYR